MTTGPAGFWSRVESQLIARQQLSVTKSPNRGQPSRKDDGAILSSPAKSVEVTASSVAARIDVVGASGFDTTRTSRWPLAPARFTNGHRSATHSGGAVTHRPPARSPPLISKAGAARLVSTGHSASFDPPAVPLRGMARRMSQGLFNSHLRRPPCVARRAFIAESTHTTEAPKAFHRNSRSLHMSDSIVFHGFSQNDLCPGLG